jgi:hypothetical protein
MKSLSDISEISSEYTEFVATAKRIAFVDIMAYPLEKMETKRERFEKHLIGMMEMYDSKQGGRSTKRIRLDTFKEIYDWLSKQDTQSSAMVQYLLNNIRDLEEK